MPGAHHINASIMEKDIQDFPKLGATGEESYFALVGWYGAKLGDRFVLKMQGYRSSESKARKAVEVSEFFLTRNQAAQLGYYLFQITGQTPPQQPPPRSWFKRLFGGPRRPAPPPPQL